LSETLIQKHKHLWGNWCLCFWISASLCRRPKAGDSPALLRDPPIFDSSILRIFVLTVGAFGVPRRCSGRPELRRRAGQRTFVESMPAREFFTAILVKTNWPVRVLAVAISAGSA